MPERKLIIEVGIDDDAVKHARNISTKNALITVDVPVGLYLILSILVWIL